ncbi:MULTISPECIES: ABC transporter substrate-binding protein [Bradyrhizobium]|jgi:hypothetical protein|uniref:ABC transporter substrate-binding protein n=1 Tax=Bradyrhizobium japonicum TaxID=375 RepID=UPI0003FEAD62
MKYLSIAAGVALSAISILSAKAADAVRFGLCYDLTKAYTFVTPQVAQAAKDYADILNAQGGIEGHPVEMVVQDHGNEPQRGIECYEKLKRDGVMVFDTLSTPVSDRPDLLGPSRQRHRVHQAEIRRQPEGSQNRVPLRRLSVRTRTNRYHQDAGG